MFDWTDDEVRSFLLETRERLGNNLDQKWVLDAVCEHPDPKLRAAFAWMCIRSEISGAVQSVAQRTRQPASVVQNGVSGIVALQKTFLEVRPDIYDDFLLQIEHTYHRAAALKNHRKR